MDRTLHVVADRPAPAEAPIHAEASTIDVVAAFRLTDAGRKASLLAGGTGRRNQMLALSVSTTRLHLVHVDADGTARLRLQPQFQMRPDQRLIRIDEPPEYDAPPSPERLLHDAARNHQLEATYRAQGTAIRTHREDTSRTWRDGVAVAFLADPERRALPHPSPTSRRCVVPTDRGRVTFDARTDRGAARDVPGEAHRRFLADLQARRARAAEHEAVSIVAQGEKRRLVFAWVTDHGSADQRERVAAGVLPLDEGIAAMAAARFGQLDALTPYERDGVVRLERYLRSHTAYAHVAVAPEALTVTTRELAAASAAQWAVLQQVRHAVPEAQVFLRERALSWAADTKAPRLRLVTVLAIVKAGPVTLRREFLVQETVGTEPRQVTT